jgi:hypothetical protein
MCDFTLTSENAIPARDSGDPSHPFHDKQTLGVDGIPVMQMEAARTQ